MLFSLLPSAGIGEAPSPGAAGAKGAKALLSMKGKRVKERGLLVFSVSWKSRATPPTWGFPTSISRAP